jgi:hypothetical protein
MVWEGLPGQCLNLRRRRWEWNARSDRLGFGAALASEVGLVLTPESGPFTTVAYPCDRLALGRSRRKGRSRHSRRGPRRAAAPESSD